MSQFWFKPKTYGWGIARVLCWQGYLALAALVVVLFGAAYLDGMFTRTIDVKGQMRFILDVLILSTLFCLVVDDKVEGGLGWRWGDRQK